MFTNNIWRSIILLFNKPIQRETSYETQERRRHWVRMWDRQKHIHSNENQAIAIIIIWFEIQFHNPHNRLAAEWLPFMPTQSSWIWQQASTSSHGFSPAHPVHPTPQYFPYLIPIARPHISGGRTKQHKRPPVIEKILTITVLRRADRAALDLLHTFNRSTTTKWRNRESDIERYGKRIPENYRRIQQSERRRLGMRRRWRRRSDVDVRRVAAAFSLSLEWYTAELWVSSLEMLVS